MPIFKRRKSNQEYDRSMNLIKSQHATENNYSFMQNSKTKKKTNDHQRRYHMDSPEVDCAKLTWRLSLIKQLILVDKGNAGSLYGLSTPCCMDMDFWYSAISVKTKKMEKEPSMLMAEVTVVYTECKAMDQKVTNGVHKKWAFGPGFWIFKSFNIYHN